MTTLEEERSRLPCSHNWKEKNITFNRFNPDFIRKYLLWSWKNEPILSHVVCGIIYILPFQSYCYIEISQMTIAQLFNLTRLMLQLGNNIFIFLFGMLIISKALKAYESYLITQDSAKVINIWVILQLFFLCACLTCFEWAHLGSVQKTNPKNSEWVFCSLPHSQSPHWFES